MIPNIFQWSIWRTARTALERITERSWCRANRWCRPALPHHSSHGVWLSAKDLLLQTISCLLYGSIHSDRIINSFSLCLNIPSSMNRNQILMSLYSNQLSLVLCLPSHSQGQTDFWVSAILETPKLGVQTHPIIMISPLSFQWSETIT